MALPKTEEEAAAAVQTARKLDVSPFFLGNGSNLLVPDEGFLGFVLKLSGQLCQVQEDGASSTLQAGAGATMARLAAAALGRGLTGLEFAGGIPGTVGGGVTMNAGAYGGEIAQVLDTVTALDSAGQLVSFKGPDCGFGYRHSVFSGGELLILRAAFRLEPGDPAVIRAKMEDLSVRRQSKQPLEYPSAGSVFKRPEGHFAGALIEQCGLKGLTVGGAQVSEKHAGFIVNRGGATCRDVLALVEQIQSAVREQTGVELEMEIKVLTYGKRRGQAPALP
jgi:UDP-N-acetylmuramate dehydrogenase